MPHFHGGTTNIFMVGQNVFSWWDKIYFHGGKKSGEKIFSWWDQIYFHGGKKSGKKYFHGRKNIFKVGKKYIVG